MYGNLDGFCWWLIVNTAIFFAELVHILIFLFLPSGKLSYSSLFFGFFFKEINSLWHYIKLVFLLLFAEAICFGKLRGEATKIVPILWSIGFLHFRVPFFMDISVVELGDGLGVGRSHELFIAGFIFDLCEIGAFEQHPLFCFFEFTHNVLLTIKYLILQCPSTQKQKLIIQKINKQQLKTNSSNNSGA